MAVLNGTTELTPRMDYGAYNAETTGKQYFEIADAWRGEYREVNEDGLVTTVNKGLSACFCVAQNTSVFSR